MDFLTLLEIILLDAGFSLTALGVGTVALRWLERVVAAGEPGPEELQPPSVLRFGASLLTGFGLLAYAGVVLGVVHAFYAGALVAVLVAAFVATRHEIWDWLRHIAAAASWLARAPRDPVTTTAGLAVAVLVVTFFLGAVAPPVARDALSYHLPQAHELSGGHVLWLNMGGHPFYGSIPKLIEVLFAEGISLQGDALAQVFHLSLLFAFLIFVWGTIERFFDRRYATLAVLALLGYQELISNATSAMIDAGVVSFEIAGVLAAASWIQSGRSSDAVRAALFIGFAAASKYSALVSVLLLGVAAIIVARRQGWDSRRFRSAALGLGAIVFAVAGYWYVKNLVKYGNPTYPLYFGHRGVTDEHYRAIVADIQQFGPRTIGEFIRIPSRFERLADVIPFASFFAAPFVLLVGRARAFTASLLAYAAIYVPYWFFIATHQVRFLMPALCVLIILGTGAVAPLLGRIRTLRAVAVAGAAGLALVGIAAAAGRFADVKRIPGTVSRGENAKYALGLESGDDFLTRSFGCQYRVVAWLNQHHERGNVLDNWSQWHDANVAYFSKGHEFVSVASPARRTQYRSVLAHRGVRFYYFRSATRVAWNGTTDPGERQWYQERIALDNAAAQASRPVYTYEDCHLERIIQ